ncbi:MAG: hypothetical protein Q9220_007682 [cf. Caloplaca sp. 1 TL-2023]
MFSGSEDELQRHYASHLPPENEYSIDFDATHDREGLGGVQAYVADIQSKAAMTLMHPISAATFVTFMYEDLQTRRDRKRRPWLYQLWLDRSKGATFKIAIGPIIRGDHITRNINVRLKANQTISVPEESTFAWVFSLFNINDTCLCAHCALQIFQFPDISLVCEKNYCDVFYPSYLTTALTATAHHFCNGGLYQCETPGCAHKSKRWGDLKRHISTSHCLNAKKFPCAYPGCERGGDNGFPRKDKLKSHFESVHRGKGIPSKQSRALAPRQ